MQNLKCDVVTPRCICSRPHSAQRNGGCAGPTRKSQAGAQAAGVPAAQVGQPCVCRLAQVLERHAPTLGWLSLAGNALTRLPDALGGLAALRYLDLSGNALEALPAGVLVLPSLQARPAASLVPKKIESCWRRCPPASCSCPACRRAPPLHSSSGSLEAAPVRIMRLPSLQAGPAAAAAQQLLEALPAGVLRLPSLQARPAAPAAQQPVKTAPVSVLRPPSLQAGPAAHPAGPSARALPGGAPQGRGSGSADAPAGRSGGARSRRS